MMIGLYQPGRSFLHRTPAGAKFLALLAFAVSLFVLPTPASLAIPAVTVVLGYVLARVPLKPCLRLARTFAVLLSLMFIVQWWFLGAHDAAVVVLRLFAGLAAANLFTLTTKVDDVVSAVQRALRPLARIGVRPERIGLLVGLTLRAVAALSGIAAEVREAQQARGRRSPSAFAVPFVVRTLRHADELGEALTARGFADD